MTLYFITSNKNKFDEVRKLLNDIDIKQLEMSLDEIQSLDSKKIISHKLGEASKIHAGEFIVEDTSLEFVGMNGLPGPFIKYFVDNIGINGLYGLSKQFGNEAIAKTIIGYKDKDGKILFFEGIKHGIIVKPRGEKNFSWDPVFIPEGHKVTYAEMTIEQKNKISHRKLAIDKLKFYLSTSM